MHTCNGATIIKHEFWFVCRIINIKISTRKCISTSVLVAASGNRQICIGPVVSRCAAHTYPAAYNYVLGIEDVIGI